MFEKFNTGVTAVGLVHQSTANVIKFHWEM